MSTPRKKRAPPPLGASRMNHSRHSSMRNRTSFIAHLHPTPSAQLSSFVFRFSIFRPLPPPIPPSTNNRSLNPARTRNVISLWLLRRLTLKSHPYAQKSKYVPAPPLPHPAAAKRRRRKPPKTNKLSHKPLLILRPYLQGTRPTAGSNSRSPPAWARWKP